MNITREDLDAVKRVIDFLNSEEYDELSSQLHSRVHRRLREEGYAYERGETGWVFILPLRDEDSAVSYEDDVLRIDGSLLPYEALFGNRAAYVESRVKYYQEESEKRKAFAHECDMKQIARLRSKYPAEFKRPSRRERKA